MYIAGISGNFVIVTLCGKSIPSILNQGTPGDASTRLRICRPTRGAGRLAKGNVLLVIRGYVTAMCLAMFGGLMLAGDSLSADQESNWSAGYLRHGTSVRARGLAGTYTSLVDDASAMLYNPSGLMRVDGLQLMGVFDNQGYSTVRFTSALAVPRSSWLGDFWGKYAAFGVAWTHLYSGKVEVHDNSGRSLTSNGSEGTLFLSAAGEMVLGSRFNVSTGASWKHLYQDYDDLEMANGVDWGLQLQVLRLWGATPQKLMLPLRFGLMYENAVQPKFGSRTGVPSMAPRSLRVGVSYSRLPLHVFDLETTLAYQWDFREESDWQSRSSAGVEIVKRVADFPVVAMRAGWDRKDETWTFSIGLRSPVKSADVGIDVLIRDKRYHGNEPSRHSKVNSLAITYTASKPNTAAALMTKAGKAAPRSWVREYYAWQVLARYPNPYVCRAVRLLVSGFTETDQTRIRKEFDCEYDPPIVDPPADSIRTSPESR